MNKLKYIIGFLALAAIFGMNIRHAINDYGVKKNLVLAGTTGSDGTSGTDDGKTSGVKKTCVSISGSFLVVTDVHGEGAIKAGISVGTILLNEKVLSGEISGQVTAERFNHYKTLCFNGGKDNCFYVEDWTGCENNDCSNICGLKK